MLVASLLDALADAALDWLAANLVNRFPPRRPKRPSAHLTREQGSMLFYKPVLGTSGAPDVVASELTWTVNGGPPTSELFTDSLEIGVQAGDVVVLTQVDIDDAGNRSEPSPAFEFTAADTLAPPAPGAPGVILVREEPDTPPTP